MQIQCSALYEKQLKEILASIAEVNIASAKNYKMYLDTLIVNIPTKAKKYKKSIYFDDENIKDLQHEEYTIVFVVEDNYASFSILGIVKRA